MKKINSKNKIPFQVNNKMQVCIFENVSLVDFDVILPKQSHGNKIVEIINKSEDLNGVDGLFTKDKNFKIGVATSDCAPVCLSDGEKIGIVHVGWRGLVSEIFENILINFNKNDLVVYVAPFLHSFEIKRDFCFDELKSKFGEEFFEYKDDKIYFNFEGALKSILPYNTIWDSRDIKSDLSLPSNRRGDKYNFVTAVGFNNN